MKKLFSEKPFIKSDSIALRQLTPADADGLRGLTEDEDVYRYLPTVLYERQYDDALYVIEHMYDEGFNQSFFFGVFDSGEFRGLIELYDYDPDLSKVSVGCRILSEYWGRGLAPTALKLMVDYLFSETDILAVTASSMSANYKSSVVLQKFGFERTSHNTPKDWGYNSPINTDKWMLRKTVYYKDLNSKI